MALLSLKQSLGGDCGREGHSAGGWHHIINLLLILQPRGSFALIAA